MVIKQTSTTTILRKPVILPVISFFALALFFGLYANSASVVFAAAFERQYYCIPAGAGLVECCALIDGSQWCTICDNTSPPSNCGPRYPDPIVAPPPSTQTCPENTALDANGNCAPSTQGPPSTEPPSTDQGTQSPPATDDNNKPSKPELPKGGDILGLQPTD